MENDSPRRQPGRRSVVRGILASLFGFVSVGTALAVGAEPAVAAAECTSGRRYRKLRAIVGQGKPICIYDYYDKYTLKFCFSETIPC